MFMLINVCSTFRFSRSLCKVRDLLTARLSIAVPIRRPSSIKREKGTFPFSKFLDKKEVSKKD